MGFHKPHAVDGTEYPHAYWKISERQFLDYRKGGEILFACYESKEARDKNIHDIIDYKSFNITPDKYDEFFDKHSSKQNCYIFAMTVPEVSADDIEGDSFFSDAVDA